MRLHTSFLISAVILLSTIVSVAAQTEESKKYLIEVVVFENSGPDTSDHEVWNSDRDIEIEIEKPKASTKIMSDETIISHVKSDSLNKYTSELRKSGRYNVLTHVSWLQPATRKSTAPLVPIDKNSILHGHLRFYSKQLLFLELELRFNRSISGNTETTVPSSPTYYHATNYKIKQTRRIKINDIHYFDHPYFGALVKVSRWTKQP